MAVGEGLGTTVTFGTSSFAMQKTEVNGPGPERASIGTSHLGTTGAHTFIPAGLVDGGVMSLTGYFDPAIDHIVDNAAETITIAWQGTTKTWAFSGYMTKLTPTAKLGELMGFTADIKVAGAITVTP